MSDTTTNPDTAPEPTEPTESTSPNAEAAKYRRQLRDAEAQRDQYAAQVEALQRSAIERVVEQDHGIKPAAVWANGTDLADLLDDDGVVDPGKVADAVKAAQDTLGVMKPPTGTHVPGAGRSPSTAPSVTWDNLIRG